MKRTPSSRRSLRLVAVLVGAVAIGGAPAARCTTWSVARTGPADFTVIQDAVDAAASGDTITLGPGRYDEWTVVISGNVVNYVFIDDKDLTIIGSGPDQTIIGLEDPPFPSTVYVYGIRALGLDTDMTLRLEGVGFSDIRGDGLAFEQGRLEVANCRFERMNNGINAIARNGGFVRDCQLSDINGFGVGLGNTSTNVQVTGCRFIENGRAVSVYSFSNNVEISACRIRGGRTGISFNSHGSGTARDCSIYGQDTFGIVLDTPGITIIESNTIDVNHATDDPFGVYLYGVGDPCVLRDNVITASGLGRCLGGQFPITSLQAVDNHFLRTGDTAMYVKAYNGNSPPAESIHVDLTRNWWGTTDPEYVATWIEDYNDDPDLKYIVDYIPMLESPVVVEESSLGGVKALFRGR